MSKALPERIQPLRLAGIGQSLAGSVALDRLPRLSEMLAGDAGPVEFALRFERDEANRPRVGGHIRARLVVICQRCLEPMEIGLEREVRLAIVRDDEEAAGLDGSDEPLQVSDEPIPLTGLLEDELILAMPGFSRHPPGACEMPPGADAPEDEVEGGEVGHGGGAGDAGEENPFSILESLKSRKTT